MNPFVYAVSLAQGLPEEVLRLLGANLFLRAGDHYVLSTHFEPEYPFVKLALRYIDESNTGLLRVWLPTQYILAVEEVASNDVQKIGFFSQTKSLKNDA